MRFLVGICLLALSAGVVLEAAEQQGSRLQGTLAYVRLTQGTWQVWQKDLATGAQKQITAISADKRVPTWTQDGQITYCTTNQSCFQIRPGEQGSEPLLSDLWPVRDVAWSPDGATLAFSRFRTDIVDSANIWVADASGENRRMLTQDSGIQQQPAWSPSGAQIAFSAGQGYGTYEIYVINADGSNRRRLTNNTTHDFLPAWSPDGTQIAWSSDATGDYEIWVMNADGGNARQLTNARGLDTRPCWSPDGRFIAFGTNRSGTLEIWVMNADGTNPQLLEKSAGGASDPAWR